MEIHVPMTTDDTEHYVCPVTGENVICTWAVDKYAVVPEGSEDMMLVFSDTASIDAYLLRYRHDDKLIVEGKLELPAPEPVINSLKRFPNNTAYMVVEVGGKVLKRKVPHGS